MTGKQIGLVGLGLGSGLGLGYPNLGAHTQPIWWVVVGINGVSGFLH